MNEIIPCFGCFFSLLPILDTFKESFKVFERDGVSCFMISFFFFFFLQLHVVEFDILFCGITTEESMKTLYED